MKIKLDIYNQTLVNLCETENFKTRLNEVKVFTKPMRTGKNFSECNFRIPYLISKHDIKLHIATSPLTGIILENQESLEKGYNTVTYWTNMKCFTQDKTLEFIEELRKLGLLPQVSLNVDEFDTWTMSHHSKSAEVKGFKIPSESAYRASMYKFTSTLAKYSSWRTKTIRKYSCTYR